MYNLSKTLYYLCVVGALLHACLCTMYVQCLQKPEVDDESLRTGATDGYGLP